MHGRAPVQIPPVRSQKLIGTTSHANAWPSRPLVPNSGHCDLHSYALVRIFRQPEMVSGSASFP